MVLPRILVLLLAVVLLGQMAVPAASASDAVVHVAPSGRDANPGTSGQPVATITRALQLASSPHKNGTTTVVRVSPGVYREHVVVPPSSTAAPLTIEATGPGVVVSGAERFTAWEPLADGVYAAPWPHRWGLVDVPGSWPQLADILRRREAVFVNGEPVRQVLSASQLGSHPAAFFVDESAQKLLLRPPSGVDPRAGVEVAVRDQVLTTNQRDNLTIRGITFSHSASTVQRAGVVFNGGRGLTVEDSAFTLHNWTGLQVFAAEQVTVRASRFDHNGVMGLGMWRAKDVLVTDSSTSHNNRWRGAWADFGGWEDTNKFAATRRVTVRRHTSTGNRGTGLWFDIDVQGVVVEDSFLGNNDRHGLFLEISPGPFVVENNTICGNGRFGVRDGKADDVTLEGNRVFGNERAQWSISGVRGGAKVTDWETGQVNHIRSQRWRLRDNVFVGEGALIRNDLDQDDWGVFKASLSSDANRWYSTAANPLAVSGQLLGLAEWQADTGQDRLSLFAEPAEALVCSAAAGAADPAPRAVDEAQPVTGQPGNAGIEAHPGSNGSRFSDVPASDVHADSIDRLAESGITDGCAADRFCPRDPVSRGQMATFLSRGVLDLDQVTAPAAPVVFVDVTETSVHRPAILAVTSAGIARGCDADRYCPGAAVTRAQMATFLANSLDLELTDPSAFTDVSSGNVHAGAIGAVAAAGIALGCAEDRYCPSEQVSRAQMASFLVRALDL